MSKKPGSPGRRKKVAVVNGKLDIFSITTTMRPGFQKNGNVARKIYLYIDGDNIPPDIKLDSVTFNDSNCDAAIKKTTSDYVIVKIDKVNLLVGATATGNSKKKPSREPFVGPISGKFTVTLNYQGNPIPCYFEDVQLYID